MVREGNTYDRYLGAGIIGLAIFGILFFGIRAMVENNRRGAVNPFDYDLTRFTQVDDSLRHYDERQSIAIAGDHLYGLALGPDNRIYVAVDNSIQVYGAAAALEKTIALSEPARCLSVDAARDIYLGVADHLELYAFEGKKKAQWAAPSERALFTSIALSEDFVFVADAGNQLIWKYDKNGEVLAEIGREDAQRDIPGFLIPSPYFDVALDPDGFLWAANTGRHSLENYTYEGDFRSFWGGYSMEIEGFCGCCNPTHIAVTRDGNFITSEKGIARVKVYNRIGELISVVAGPESFSEGTVGLDLAVDERNTIYVLDPKKKAVRIFGKKN